MFAYIDRTDCDLRALLLTGLLEVIAEESTKYHKHVVDGRVYSGRIASSKVPECDFSTKIVNFI